MMTERVGLLGWPVDHSVSPALHNAAFVALGLDWQYDLLPVLPDQLASAIRCLTQDRGYRGLNVTAPHKQAAFRLFQPDYLSPAARAIGAVNTLAVRPETGELEGDNTDWQGFAADLKEHGVDCQGAACLILGTGGSARAVCYALEQGGAAAITQVSRSPRRAEGMAGYSDLSELAPAANLVVNCTPVGMYPNAAGSPWPEKTPFPSQAVLYDLVYNPPVTRLQQQTAGARAIGGLGMLVWQGALAFERWTGIHPPLDVMYKAAQAALGVD